MKVYNVGTEVFSFVHAGVQFDIKPKHGTFERKREKYTVEVLDDKNLKRSVARFRDVWVKVSDEGINSNFAEGTGKDFVEAALKQAASQERSEDIKRETEIVKQEQDRFAAIEAKNKKLESELAEREKELSLKLAMLKKVEEEAITNAALKRKV